MPGPCTVRLCAPIPLSQPMQVVHTANGCELVIENGGHHAVIAQAHPWQPDVPVCTSVDLEQAKVAHTQFPLSPRDHPTPTCFSCGYTPDGMRVQSGPLEDGRYATHWRMPSWADENDSTMLNGLLWAALDCASAWYVCCSGPQRTAFTVQLAVHQLRAVTPSETYSLVSQAGDYAPSWDGRKRGAVATAFNQKGKTVARARSFWVSVP